MSKLFFVSKDSICGNKIIIKDKEARHIKDVLRFKESDRLVCFDGTGKEYAGVIERILPRQITVKIEDIRQAPSYNLPPVTLAVAIPKKQKMDYIIEKCTELGAENIIPMLTERTLPVAQTKYSRWERIAQEASKQCNRLTVTTISKPKKFKDVLNNVRNYQLSLLPHLGEKRIALHEAIKDWKSEPLLVFIGPEGDFTPDEIKLAERAGCICVDLGPLILKVDTAAIAVLSILGYEFLRRGRH